jgi:hypothetical protein
MCLAARRKAFPFLNSVFPKGQSQDLQLTVKKGEVTGEEVNNADRKRQRLLKLQRNQSTLECDFLQCASLPGDMHRQGK